MNILLKIVNPFSDPHQHQTLHNYAWSLSRGLDGPKIDKISFRLPYCLTVSQIVTVKKNYYLKFREKRRPTELLIYY